MNEVTIFLTCLFAIILPVLIVFLILYISGVNERFAERSKRILETRKINETYHPKINNIPHKFYHLHRFDTKYKYDNSDVNEIAADYLYDDKEKWIVLHKHIDENLKLYEQYKIDVEEVLATFPPLEDNPEKETRIIRKEKLKFLDSYRITISYNYTSPQGRNSYTKSFKFNELDVANFLRKKEKQIEKLSSFEMIKYSERAKMSASLRFSILKRDHFTCQSCGATKDHGVTLHVDHIYPISKGGLSEKSNLQTLCKDCNIGKGANI